MTILVNVFINKIIVHLPVKIFYRRILCRNIAEMKRCLHDSILYHIDLMKLSARLI